VLGAGVVLGGVGVLMHTSAKNGVADYAQALQECADADAPHGCSTPTPAIYALKSDAQSSQTMAATLYTLGGITVAAGVVLVVLNRPQTFRIDPLEKQNAGGGMAITPVLGPDLAGLSAAGSF
jgi:hypothetical protein